MTSCEHILTNIKIVMALNIAEMMTQCGPDTWPVTGINIYQCLDSTTLTEHELHLTLQRFTPWLYYSTPELGSVQLICSLGKCCYPLVGTRNTSWLNFIILSIYTFQLHIAITCTKVKCYLKSKTRSKFSV